MSTSIASRSPDDHRSRLVVLQWYLLLTSAIAIAIECVYLVTVPPATGFEPSVVTAYPLPFWIAFGTVLGGSISVLLCAGLTGSKYWKHAFTLLVCNYLVFFWLPLVRGYRLYGRGSSDALAHLATTRDILTRGFLAGDAFYPQLHLLLAELSIVGLPLTVARYVVPFTFTLVFMSGMALLLREFVGDGRGLALGLGVASALVFTDFHTNVHPAMLSFMLFPPALLSLERVRRANSKRHVLLITTLALAIVFYHPVTTLLLVILILSTVAFGPVYARLGRRNTPRLRPVLALATFCTAFVWYIDIERTQSTIADVVTGSGATPVAVQTGKASEAVLTTQQLMARFVQIYGTSFIYFAIAGLFSLFVLRRVVRGKPEYNSSYGVYQFAVGAVIAVAFIGGHLAATNPIRVSRYMTFASLLLVGLLLFRNVDTTERRERAVVLVVGCAVVVAAILGAFSTYSPNKHMTASEYEGAEFVAEYQAPSVPVRSFDLTRKTYWYVTSGDPYTGWTAPAYRQDRAGYGLTYRLGYDENETVGRTFGRSYLATQEYDREYYTAEYFTRAQQRKRFVYGGEDIARMQVDPTAEKIYTNGGFEGWYIPDDGR